MGGGLDDSEPLPRAIGILASGHSQMFMLNPRSDATPQTPEDVSGPEHRSGPEPAEAGKLSSPGNLRLVQVPSVERVAYHAAVGGDHRAAPMPALPRAKTTAADTMMPRKPAINATVTDKVGALPAPGAVPTQAKAAERVPVRPGSKTILTGWRTGSGPCSRRSANRLTRAYAPGRILPCWSACDALPV